MWELTNIEPRKVVLDEKKEDVVKIVDLLIKEQFYNSIDLEVLSNVISKIEIDDIDKLVDVIGFLVGTGNKNTRNAIIENISIDLLQIISSRDDIFNTKQNRLQTSI